MGPSFFFFQTEHSFQIRDRNAFSNRIYHLSFLIRGPCNFVISNSCDLPPLICVDLPPLISNSCHELEMSELEMNQLEMSSLYIVEVALKLSVTSFRN